MVFIVDFYLCSGIFVVHDSITGFYGDFVFFCSGPTAITVAVCVFS
jgi:hypothetical protein